MNIALIRNNICENVVVFENIEQAQELLGDIYEVIVESPDGRGISHRYINERWYNSQPVKDSEGVFPYISDMCVLKGDSVHGLDHIIYEAVVNIQYQQQPPENLPESYIVKF